MKRLCTFELTSVEGALHASKEDKLQQWLHDFLLFGLNKNEDLWNVLTRKSTRTYHGPIEVPLTSLQRIAGPEPEMEYRVPVGAWNKKVDILAKAIHSGWKPQPLLAPGMGTRASIIHDGNHRYEALIRTGHTHYWTIFHFENEFEKSEFLN